ncbi:transposase [Terriglobus sp. 2YAB30_2]|uniref:REP-associated tyrosine transposase n=1 Tax=unclassified Terriglobus TaxID=2628988 RepID=UPI003F9564F3
MAITFIPAIPNDLQSPHAIRTCRYTTWVHFVTFSCDGRRPYLESNAAKDLVLESLRSASQKYEVEVIGYVIMPEHVHLLIALPEEISLGTFIQVLKVSVAKRSSQKPFWLPRYYDFNVLTTAKIREKLEYMHNNPVVRGLVPSAEMWKWSSYSIPLVV